jgi:hypothetical protein
VSGERPDRHDADWERRRRRAAVFGDAMPDTTSDERDDAPSGTPEGESAGDRWLRDQVPPHHGGQ